MAPGEPPFNQLAAQAFGLFCPNVGRAKTIECPDPSAATGQGAESLYSTSSRSALERLHNSIFPLSFGSAPPFSNGPKTFAKVYAACTSAGTAATTTKPNPAIVVLLGNVKDTSP